MAKARGERHSRDTYWEMSDGRLASGDDITAMVVNLHDARRAVRMGRGAKP